MDHYDIFLCGLCAFLWAISLTIEKYYLLTKFTSYQLLFLRPIWFALISVIFVLFYDNNFKFLNKLTQTDIFYVFLAVLFNATTLVLFYYLLHKNKTGYILSIVSPLFIVFSTLIAYLFYNEKLNLKQLLGFILVIMGIFIINNYKK